MSWIKTEDRLPDIPATQSYVKVKIRCKSGSHTTAFYCKNWGWRDELFNTVHHVLEWYDESVPR